MQHLSFQRSPPVLKERAGTAREKSNINNNLRKVQLGNRGGLTPILEHFYVLCSGLFDNIFSDPNHKLKALLPPDYDNSRYNLRRQRAFLIYQSFARTEQVILLYMRCRNSPGCSFIPLIFMLYILTYFNMNMLYRIFNVILKVSFRLIV